jgi:hypothetical protein
MASASQKKASQKQKRKRGTKRGTGKSRRAKHWVVVDGQPRAATLVTKRIYCQTCKNCRGHGPYQYLVWREGKSKKLKWKYLGKASE